VFDTARTPLPDTPDRATVEAWLRQVRIAHLDLTPDPVSTA